MPPLSPPNHEQTIGAISKCGVPRANIVIKYEDELQSDEITISDLGATTDEKLGCLKAAVHPFYILTIRDQEQQAAFYEASRKIDRPEEKARALAWVRSKKLVERLPSFNPERDVVSFAGRLERACGLKVGSALESVGSDRLTLRRDFLLGNRFEKMSSVLECLSNVFTASDATEEGIRFVIMGNEAIVGEDKE